jgi:hypothetical protein
LRLAALGCCPAPDALDFRDLTVSLADDLAARVVQDANGQAVSSR